MTHRLPFAAALLATTLLAAPAMADSDFPPAISVTGEATVSAAPDQAQLDAGVTTDAKTAREASDANNVTMGKVLAALKAAGIAEKDYQTSRLSLQPQFANRPPSSEATAKNPPCGEAKTAQLMRQEIYEVFDGAIIETD